MHTFTDNAGRVWTIAINVVTIKRVQGALQINLCKLVDDHFKGLGELLADPVRLIDVLYCLCREEAEARNVSDEDFGRAMFGDALHQAMDAFVEELIDFFPIRRCGRVCGRSSRRPRRYARGCWTGRNRCWRVSTPTAKRTSC